MHQQHGIPNMVDTQHSPENPAPPTTPWTALANLTRRDAATVRAVAVYFGLVQEVAAGGTRQVTATGDQPTEE